MKTHLTVLMLLLASLQTMAQCRLIRIENGDSTFKIDYSYDKLGRISGMESHVQYQGRHIKSEFHYFYNNEGKIVTHTHLFNDTLIFITNFIYEDGLVTKQYHIGMLDSSLRTSQLFYNDNKQLVRLVN